MLNTCMLLTVTCLSSVHSLHCSNGLSHYIFYIPRVIPQRPRDFKRLPSARVSIIARPSHPSHVIAVTMYPRPIHLTPLHEVDSSIAGVTWRHSFRFLITEVIRARTCPQEYRHLNRSDCINTLTYAHTTSRTPPHLWHEPRLANYTYAWSRRLCGITRTSHCQSCWFKILLDSFTTARCIKVRGI
jgi:hypothetical protein